ncbi:MAG TPA: EamA family transporter [Jatrophihabitans sp.]|nr:EamA family transporter [Jatrophihabitans sp.]
MHARNSFLLLVLSGVLWGTGGVTGHALADATGLSAPAIAAYRLTLGGLILTALLVRRHRTSTRWRPVLATAVLAALFQSCYFAAVALGTVSVATLITIGSAPLFVLLLDAAGHRRWPAVTQLRPVALGVVGLALLVGAPAGGRSVAAGVAGAVLAALSGLTFAIFTRYRARPSADDPEAVTGFGFLLGGLLIGLACVPFTSLTFPASARSLALLALFAIVPTALAYTLFFRGLAGASAAVATVVALLEPLTGTALAVLIFGDRLSPPAIAGAVLLLGSVVDAGRSHRPMPVEL